MIVSFQISFCMKNMKKTVFLFLFLVSSHVFAQDYKPLLDNYNEWNLRHCYTGCSSDIYYTNGDTIVDGMNFKVLDGYHYISRSFLLREDVLEKKVHLKFILNDGVNGARDYLLYDFSLEVGDSIDMKNPYSPFIENAGYYKVDAIIPLPLVDGNEYRHFYLSPTSSNTISTNEAIWVEGVGSLSIINAPSGDPDIDAVGRVACVFKNGIPFYSDLAIIEACEPTIMLNTTGFNTAELNIQVIKTQSLNQFSVVNVATLKEIEIYNLQGKKLDSFAINNQDLIGLNLSNYTAAMYVLVLKSKQGSRHVLKVIVE
ncbi:MAG: hypothetical protein ACI9RL_000634 [Candidatus Paceibacteria bacterium]|jgi:hypothetical protein